MVTRFYCFMSFGDRRFKFLYGQWLPIPHNRFWWFYLGSNSSMVNGYVLLFIGLSNQDGVQIPLWSMVTREDRNCDYGIFEFKFLYGQWLPVAVDSEREESLCSNSSMVNGYFATVNRQAVEACVQIPLWSMVTRDLTLEQINKLRSNSSMVNGYAVIVAVQYFLSGVQIPLWSMVTSPSFALTFTVGSSNSSMVNGYC
ncbi:MAG: hypothetical protein PWQ82_517 [Thermosediminibacterales bacterium]|nr:hypothetical protein [Thermosediminibacterales bacterium]